MNQANKIIKNLASFCLDLVFPKHCLGCGQEKAYVCHNCLSLISTQTSFHCYICGHRSPTGQACSNCTRKKSSRLKGILVAADWNNLLLRQIIYEYKYRFIQELAKPLSSLLINFIKLTKPAFLESGQLIIIPAPLHGRRFAWRGFNQSELLAENISNYLNAPLLKNILLRSRHTLPQREIKDKNNRQKNIAGAFSLSPKIKNDDDILKNKTVILIDDISTTGATLQECARCLQALKPKEIWGLVIARG